MNNFDEVRAGAIIDYVKVDTKAHKERNAIVGAWHMYVSKDANDCSYSVRETYKQNKGTWNYRACIAVLSSFFFYEDLPNFKKQVGIPAGYSCDLTPGKVPLQCFTFLSHKSTNLDYNYSLLTIRSLDWDKRSTIMKNINYAYLPSTHRLRPYNDSKRNDVLNCWNTNLIENYQTMVLKPWVMV